MRTTLTIDDEILAVAKNIAQDRSESVGKALSELAWKGLNATPRVKKAQNGTSFPVFFVGKRAHPITLDDVRKAEDEI